jgi:hypothetical protein
MNLKKRFIVGVLPVSPDRKELTRTDKIGNNDISSGI